MKANISDTFWEARTHEHFTKADLALWAGKVFSQASQGPRTEPLQSWAAVGSAQALLSTLVPDPTLSDMQHCNHGACFCNWLSVETVVFFFLKKDYSFGVSHTVLSEPS